MRPTKLLLTLVVIVVMAWPGARPVLADTVILDDGTERGFRFNCLIHEGTEVTFKKPDPENWLEFELGFITMSVPVSIVSGTEENDLYTRPDEVEELFAQINRIRDGIQYTPEPGETTGEAARPTPTPVREITQDLTAEVVYLVNFAQATHGGMGDPIAVVEGDQLPPGTELSVKKNSRAEAAVGPRVRVGIRASSRVRFEKMEEDRREGTATWTLTIGVPEGKVWIEVSGLEAGEKVVLRVIGTVFTVMGDALFSVESALGLEYDFAYWTGPSDLRIQVPGREAGGFNIRPRQMVTFSPTGTGELDVEQLSEEGVQEWRDWREFEPVEVDLEPRVIPPPMEPLGSEDVLYSLREAGGGQNIEVRPEIKASVLQDLEAHRGALEGFLEDVGRYPTLEEGLSALRENPGIAEWDGPYLPDTIQSIDPWGQPYRYRLLGEGEAVKPAVYSSGQNEIDEFGLGSDIW